MLIKLNEILKFTAIQVNKIVDFIPETRGEAPTPESQRLPF